MTTIRRLMMFAALALLAACGGAAAWRELAIDEAGFSVLMRGQPTYARQPVDTGAGKTEAHLYSSDRRDAYYAIGYSDYPVAMVVGGDANALLSGVRDVWMKRVEGRALISSPLALNGTYPGLEFSAEGTFKGTPCQIQGRLYLVDQRLFQLIAITRKNEVPQGVVNRFLRSFKLIRAVNVQHIEVKPPPAKSQK